MMKNTCLMVLFTILVFSLFVSRPVLADNFSLDTIGNSQTAGQRISKWWYTGLQPTLSGRAAAASEVKISIDGTSATTIVDSTGKWSYKPASPLGEGDHAVTISNSGTEIKFTLTLGSNVDYATLTSSSSTLTTLPVTATAWPTVVLTAAGIGITAAGFRYFRQS